MLVLLRRGQSWNRGEACLSLLYALHPSSRLGCAKLVDLFRCEAKRFRSVGVFLRGRLFRSLLVLLDPSVVITVVSSGEDIVSGRADLLRVLRRGGALLQRLNLGLTPDCSIRGVVWLVSVCFVSGAVVWLLSGSSFLNNVSALSCGCYSPRISMSGWVGCSLGGRLRAVLG
ncbi:hypothetical protein Bca4012_051505 [Brassica carinata]